jgi:hypothetical protein
MTSFVKILLYKREKAVSSRVSGGVGEVVTAGRDGRTEKTATEAQRRMALVILASDPRVLLALSRSGERRRFLQLHEYKVRRVRI